ncbi:MAG TPA: MBL fold metallo-hydrolase [Thermomicrobiales bacterium]|nr:MBL fold metallo-hydrolase [Thermomicrobiales bacterium]
MAESELVILGSAQDGGLPHAGCLCPNCRAARADHTRRRLPASAGIVSGDQLALIDATSAFEEQYHMLWERSARSKDFSGERYGAPEIVVLTHAHTGHYTGLWQLDRSVLAARGTRVLSPPKMYAFLAAQEPWAGMQREGFIVLEPLPLDTAFELLPGITLTAVEVPHRAEWETDTVALLIAGPNAITLYLPDIDRWDEWEHDIASIVSTVDAAFLDGCFWNAPTSRNVPHPPVVETLERLQPLANAGKRIAFTHLNHSNPLCDPSNIAHRQVLARGYEVAREGDGARL